MPTQKNRYPASRGDKLLDRLRKPPTLTVLRLRRRAERVGTTREADGG